jgi:hypothetical protein
VRKLLSVNVLAALSALTSSASAQGAAVPGRDLLAYPIGLIAEAGAMPGMLGLGLFNPAAARLPSDTGWRIAAAAMNTPADIAASAQALGASGRWRGVTITGSLLRSAVNGIVSTDSDPVTTGNDITYSTQLMSIGAAVRSWRHVTWGAALRYRTGQLDTERRTAISADIGVVADGLTPLDIRVGASTFLWSPQSGAESATLSFSADSRIASLDSVRTLRVGASMSRTEGRGAEEFYFASLRYQVWEARLGAVNTTAFGESNMRGRVGVGVHYGSYVVGIAREGAPGGLPPSYQFVLSALIR